MIMCGQFDLCTKFHGFNLNRNAYQVLGVDPEEASASGGPPLVVRGAGFNDSVEVFAPNPGPWTLNPTPFTLHPTPCTLHPTP